MPTNPLRPPLGLGVNRDDHLRVHHLINMETITWNSNLLGESVAVEDIPHIE